MLLASTTGLLLIYAPITGFHLPAITAGIYCPAGQQLQVPLIKIISFSLWLLLASCILSRKKPCPCNKGAGSRAPLPPLHSVMQHIPFYFICLAASKSSTLPSMQKRLPVGGGPSSNTWPRCEPHRLQVTSVRSPSGSVFSVTLLPFNTW